MSTIVKRVFCRAGLLGNPSDGYGGKTISLIVRNFFAEVKLSPATNVSLIPGPAENPSFDSVYQLNEHFRQVGYFGGLRLIKATIKRFVDFAEQYLDLDCGAGFTIDYRSNIPRSVGLAGSSAIVVATLKALADHFGWAEKPDLLASLALSVERDELKIPAGLQDRVIQSREGVVYMDFSNMQNLHGLDCGRYSQLDPKLLGNLYVAYGTRAAEPTETQHGDLRDRFQQGDARVVDAMKSFADIAEQGRAAIESGNLERLAVLIDDNFDLRAQICDVNPLHLKMIKVARACGASAKFCGSGGAIIGTYPDESTFSKLESALAKIDCRVFKPQISKH